jgi:hypothetical protein
MNRKSFGRALLALVALYAVIYAARFVYDLATYNDAVPPAGANLLLNSARDDMSYVKNFASEQKVYKDTTGTQVLDQKYERISNVASKTAVYDDDLAELNAIIEKNQAVVQTENVQGLPGNRRLFRTIGVRPEFFDDCLEAVLAVGVPVSVTSQKIDKTYEYRQMLAQKQELEKRLESYVTLRDHGGSINEKINLEDRIIEVERQLLSQDVDLGEYKDENALCTIILTLQEGSRISVAQRIWSAFRWTNGFYFSLLGCIVALCAVAVVMIKSWRFITTAIPAKPQQQKTEEQ